MSGPHDFAVRLGVARLASPKRPSHPVPNVRDDRDTSLVRGRDAQKDAGDLGVRSTMRIATDWHDGQFAHGCDVRFAPRPRSAAAAKPHLESGIWFRSCSYGLGGPAVPCFGLLLSNEPIFLFMLPSLRLRRAGRSIECTVTVTFQASPLASRRLLRTQALRRPLGRTPPASCATAPA